LEDNEHQHWMLKQFSWGDLITLAVLMLTMAGGYASLRKDVQALQAAVGRLDGRDITPGAAQRLSVLEVRVLRGEEEDRRLGEELKEQRREILGELRDISAKLEAHMEKNR